MNLCLLFVLQIWVRFTFEKGISEATLLASATALHVLMLSSPLNRLCVWTSYYFEFQTLSLKLINVQEPAN